MKKSGYAVYYGESEIGKVLTNRGMTDEEICEACEIELAQTKEEYEYSPENGKYILDDLVINAW